MNIIEDIRRFPTTLTTKYVEKVIAASRPEGFHESLLRSYHILAKAKDYLDQGTPPNVVLDLIEAMEAAPQPAESDDGMPF